MPSGAFVELQPFTWRRGMNVYVNLPPRDHGITEGLCGTFDQNRQNDFKLSNGEYLHPIPHNYWWVGLIIDGPSNKLIHLWKVGGMI